MIEVFVLTRENLWYGLLVVVFFFVLRRLKLMIFLQEKCYMNAREVVRKFYLPLKIFSGYDVFEDFVLNHFLVLGQPNNGQVVRIFIAHAFLSSGRRFDSEIVKILPASFRSTLNLPKATFNPKTRLRGQNSL